MSTSPFYAEKYQIWKEMFSGWSYYNTQLEISPAFVPDSQVWSPNAINTLVLLLTTPFQG